MVTMTVVTIVIIARGSSSMVAVMIARRKPIVAAIVSHALVTLWSTIVLASGDMPARTAVGVAACRSTASSRSITATGIVATAAFCNECQLMGVESLSAGQVGDSSQSYFIGCCRISDNPLRGTRLPVHRDYFRRKRRRSMQSFASATASSLSGAMVERVDRDMMGKSARLAYMPVHQLDHCHMGTMSYPRYW